MKKYLQVLILLCVVSSCQHPIQEISYLSRPHFEVTTGYATYLYDIRGGGFSSIKDREGNEWIGYQPGPGKVPESAASNFRGLPNLVFRGDDNGAGHPGFDQCESYLINDNTIETKTLSGKWKWQWTFKDQGAYLNMLEVDSLRNYWFLYEGTPGGVFDPMHQYWGNNLDGFQQDTPSIQDAVARGQWNWVYFGHQKVQRSLVVIQHEQDTLTDNFSYMGNEASGIYSSDGMVVFGFGRTDATPLMNRKNHFFVGFCECEPSDKRCLEDWVQRLNF